MIYTLILTIVMNGYREHSVTHYEHDYPTRDVCHQAYEIAKQSVYDVADTGSVHVSGTCFGHPAT